MSRRGGAGGPDPEEILAQALRAMAGGGRGQRDTDAGSTPNRERLGVLQIALIATIIGLLVGITIGLVTLLV